MDRLEEYLRFAVPYYIAEGNAQVMIGKENYFLSSEGLLMPTQKNQAPPDLRYFTSSKK